jgi:hypothetical protein
MSSGPRDFAAASTTRGRPPGRYAPGAGWIAFAATMLGLAGVWNTINGLLAIGSSRVFVDDADYVFGDLQAWGWIIIVLGVLQLVASFGVVSGSYLARWFGIGVAAVNAVGQLLYLPSYPLWAMALFAVDVLIIHALTVYGGRPTEDVA